MVVVALLSVVLVGLVILVTVILVVDCICNRFTLKKTVLIKPPGSLSGRKEYGENDLLFEVCVADCLKLTENQRVLRSVLCLSCLALMHL